MKYCLLLLIILSFSLSRTARCDENLPMVDLAKLFPAKSVAYVEIAKPGEVLDWVQRLFGKRLSADLLKTIHDRQDRAKNANELIQARATARLELLFSPALAEELKRVGPVGFAILELTPQKQVRYACVVALQRSAAMRLIVQNYLSTGNVRRVGSVDGLAVYQQRGFVPPTPRPAVPVKPAQKKDEKAKPPSVPTYPASAGEMEPTFALMDDYLLIASDRKAVSDIQQRIKGAVREQSLADSPRFQQHALQRRVPGIYFYGEPTLAIQQLSHELERGFFVDTLAMMNFVAGEKWIRSMAGTMEFGPKEITVKLQLETDPKLSSPLAAWMRQRRALASNRVVPLDDLAWGVMLDLPDVETQLALLDGIAKGQGKLGQLPSKRMAVDDPARLTLNRLQCVSALMLKRGDAPVVQFRFDDESAASNGLAMLPQILALAVDREQALPISSDLVAGQRIYSIPGTQLPDAKTLYYAQQGSRIAMSQSRDAVIMILERQPELGKNAALARFQFQPTLFVGPEKAKSSKKNQPELEQAYRGRSRRYYPNGVPTNALTVSWWKGLEPIVRALPTVKGSVDMRDERIIIDATMPNPGESLPKAWETYLNELMQQPDGNNGYAPKISDGFGIDIPF